MDLMSEILVFVSCGQQTQGEKQLGVLLKTVIDGTPGFRAYFAETVHDLEGLSSNIFEALRRCAGAVIVLHDRGVVLEADGKEWGHRSSVWVNQEIAILAYRRFSESSHIPILTFVDHKVKLEGAMTGLIVNPRPLGDAQALVDTVRSWLSEQQFASVADEVFIDKWNRLPDPARKVVACLLDQGGINVKETAVRNALMSKFQMDKESASRAVHEAKPYFIDTDFVKLIPNRHSGDELSLHPTWNFQLQRQVAQWRQELPTR